MKVRSRLEEAPFTSLRLEIIIIILINATFLWLFSIYDVLEILYEFSASHEELEIDEIIPLFMTISVSLLVFSHRRYREAVVLSNKLESTSNIDSLTGLYNRRYVTGALSDEINRTKRSSSSFSILLIDIDNFKKINDEYGHNVGDDVLVEFGQIVQENIRSVDVASRWGGEEFLLLCRDTDLQGACQVAEKLLNAIRAYEFHAISRLTASIGVATIEDDDAYSSLVARADALLYQVKKSGKNAFLPKLPVD